MQPLPSLAAGPTKFMVELSRAMQGAAETSRDETLARFGADAKAAVEEIHAAATVEAADLRRRADDDVAAVREWSKAEIARIREETEGRIAARKTVLDTEIGEHEQVVEARVDFVGTTVSNYEAEMAAFFERLLAEQDPTRIAAMAEIHAGAAGPGGPRRRDHRSRPPSGSRPAAARGDRRRRCTRGASHGGRRGRRGARPEHAESATPELAFAAAEAEAAAFSGEAEDEAAGLRQRDRRNRDSDHSKPRPVTSPRPSGSAPDAGRRGRAKRPSRNPERTVNGPRPA